MKSSESGFKGSSALSVQVHAAFEISQGSTLAFRSSKPARPYICRLIALRRLMCPSIGPLLQGVVIDSSTASKSRPSEEAPGSWKPPLLDEASIRAGKELWLNAPLVASSLPDSPRIEARCTDCHAHDERDLTYFNFSNTSIVTRSRFHGLTTRQGEQIASYIRSLPFPNPGRPVPWRRIYSIYKLCWCFPFGDLKRSTGSPVIDQAGCPTRLELAAASPFATRNPAKLLRSAT